MITVTEKGQEILGNSQRENKEVYRGVMELLARFGYVSVQEVMASFDVTLKEACHRLDYLVDLKFIERFASFVLPSSFYCLTALGREAAKRHNISDEIRLFRSSGYNASTQLHDRALVRIYVTLRKILGLYFQNWVSESTLKQDAISMRSQTKGRRVFDGEFVMRVKKTMFAQSAEGNLSEIGTSEESWRCGVECELSLKSPERYRTQFKSLASHVYDPIHKKQLIPLMLFLSRSETIQERLVRHLTEKSHLYGSCTFMFGLVDPFLEKRDQASLLKLITPFSSSSEPRIITAGEMNRVKVKVAS